MYTVNDEVRQLTNFTTVVSLGMLIILTVYIALQEWRVTVYEISEIMYMKQKKMWKLHCQHFCGICAGKYDSPTHKPTPN